MPDDRCMCGHLFNGHRTDGTCLVCGCNTPMVVTISDFKRGSHR